MFKGGGREETCKSQIGISTHKIKAIQNRLKKKHQLSYSFLPLFLLIEKRGRVGREVEGMFKWEGAWVNLWLIHVDVS